MPDKEQETRLVTAPDKKQSRAAKVTNFGYYESSTQRTQIK